MDNKNGLQCGGHFPFRVVWLLSAAPEAEGESAQHPRLSFVMFHFSGLGMCTRCYSREFQVRTRIPKANRRVRCGSPNLKAGNAVGADHTPSCSQKMGVADQCSVLKVHG